MSDKKTKISKVVNYCLWLISALTFFFGVVGLASSKKTGSYLFFLGFIGSTLVICPKTFKLIQEKYATQWSVFERLVFAVAILFLLAIIGYMLDFSN